MSIQSKKEDIIAVIEVVLDLVVKYDSETVEIVTEEIVEKFREQMITEKRDVIKNLISTIP